MSAADWIAIAGISAPVSGSLIMFTIRVTALLTRMSDQLASHENRLTRGGL